jgi:hypothetical protein
MTQTLSTTVLKNGIRARPAPSPVPMFFLFGLLETVLAYFAFSRADDHAYFLELANLGTSVVPDYSQDLLTLKAKAAGAVFYAIATPSRWLGGHELIHLLWFRGLTLAGFLSAFSWLQHVTAPGATSVARNKARMTFMTLVLLYPGQLAWTASLLRDGVATALFFFGLACLRKDWRLLLTLPLFGASFALRPEYSLILFCLVLAMKFHRLLERFSWRVLTMIGVLLAFSISTYSTRAESAAFAQLAFGDGGMAYPLVNSPFDVMGYLRVFLQGVLDPIALDAPQFNAFGLIDCAFFAYLLLQSRRLLRHRLTMVAALSAALLFGLWTFAYFEIYVSGFSRHRLCLQVALIALIAICRVGKTHSRRKLAPR